MQEAVMQRLREVTEKLDIRPTNLGKRLNLSHTVVLRVLNGDNLPSTKMLIPLGTEFGISTDWVLFGAGEMFLDTPIGQQQKKIAEGLEVSEPKSKYKVSPNSVPEAGLSECRKEVQHLKEIIEEKNKQIEDKQEIINLLKEKKA